MFLQQKLRFTWDLTTLPTYEPKLKSTMKLHDLGPNADIDAIWTTIERSHATDQSWGVGLKERLKQLEDYVHYGINDAKLTFMAIEDGPRYIAVSGLHPVAGTEMPQLITGVCVTNEYRCRGLGTALLYASLKFLKDAGLNQASVITKERLTASKYLYPKFDSASEIIRD
jgi:ribosomal protein S18 acetylase RimI-like enzyme